MKKLTLARLHHPRKRRRSVRRLLQLARIPQLVEGRDFRLLWSYGGYDGTCSGICDLSDALCFYQNAVSIEARSRLFVVVQLTSTQAQQHVAYHERYVELIGRDRDYAYVDGKRRYATRQRACSDDAYHEARAILELEFFGFKVGGWSAWQAPHQNNRIVGFFP